MRGSFVLMLPLVLMSALLGSGVGLLFGHWMAGAIIGALIPLVMVLIMVLGGLLFFHLLARFFN